MMMLIMAMTLSMEIKMLDGPICENVLQTLDMAAPKPWFLKRSRSASAAGDTGK